MDPRQYAKGKEIFEEARISFNVWGAIEPLWHFFKHKKIVQKECKELQERFHNLCYCAQLTSFEGRKSSFGLLSVLKIVPKVVIRRDGKISGMDQGRVMKCVGFFPDWACGDDAVPPGLRNDRVSFNVLINNHDLDKFSDEDCPCNHSCLFRTLSSDLGIFSKRSLITLTKDRIKHVRFEAVMTEEGASKTHFSAKD